MRKTRILFVDDEHNVLEALRRSLRGQTPDWDVRYAQGGQEALDMMAEEPADVVVTDIAMPEMDGKALIIRLFDAFPATVPLVLSGHWTPATAHRQVGPGVRFLAKPVSRDALLAALSEAVKETRLTQWGDISLSTTPSLNRNATPPTEDLTWLDAIDRTP